MPAMTMRFPLRTPEVPPGIAPGVRVRFQVVRENQDLVITRLAAVGLSAGRARPGLHDHTPHHGGVVAMAGTQHLEALARPDGTIRVYLTDLWRRPVSVAEVTARVTLELRDGKRVLPLAAGSEALEAKGPPLAGREVRAHVLVEQARRAPIDIHFLLPLEADATGAGVLPAEAASAGRTRRRRLPRRRVTV